MNYEKVVVLPWIIPPKTNKLKILESISNIIANWLIASILFKEEL